MQQGEDMEALVKDITDKGSFVFNGFEYKIVSISDIEIPEELVREFTLDDEFEPFKNNIKEKGLREPVEIDKDNELIDGLRRLKAMLAIGEKEIPAKVRVDGNSSNFLEGFLANMLRKDMEPLEKSNCINKLINEEGYKQKQIADLLGWSPSKVSMVKSLSKLPDSAKDLLKSGDIDVTSAYELARLEAEEVDSILEEMQEEEDEDLEEEEQDSDTNDGPSKKESVSVSRDYLGDNLRIKLFKDRVKVSIDIEHKEDNFNNFNILDSIENIFLSLFKESSEKDKDLTYLVGNIDELNKVLSTLKAEIV